MKAKMILQLINITLFWGPVIWLGVTYGWQLPVGVILLLISFYLQVKSIEL